VVKSVVIYDSEFGNTRQIAEAIASELSVAGAVLVENARCESLRLPADVDLLVVGGPTQVHGVSPQLREKLEGIRKHGLDGVMAATFDTRAHGPRFLTGAASVGIAKRLKQRGAKLVGKGQSFVVQSKEGPLYEGELERARAWTRDIREQLEDRTARRRARVVH
jgi:flavodoxin